MPKPQKKQVDSDESDSSIEVKKPVAKAQDKKPVKKPV